MPRAGLTARQRRFVEEYGVDRNGAAAAVRAGYSPRSAKQTAYELLTKPDLQAAVAAQEALVAAETGVTRQRVLQGLLEALEMARYRRDPGAMIGALREIGRILGYYAPERVAVGAGRPDSPGESGFTRLSDSELTVIIGGRVVEGMEG